ncbi:hypothetical protein Bcon01_74880 [Burkholderia contaminans]|nr:hypothetical protein Bcon01_74880 [Burkholderia contaminans]
MSSLRKGMDMERGAVDARLDAQEVGAAPVVGADSTLSPAVPAYGGRGNTSSVKPRLTLPLGELVSNPYNPRTFYRPEKVDELAVKMKRDGQLEAIKVTENARFPGKYVIIDGEYRFRAKKSVADGFIDAEVFPTLSDRDLFLIANSLNKDRTPQSLFDDALAYQKLLDEGVFPGQDDLAASLGISESLMSKILKLKKLPETLLRRMAEADEPLGITHAYNIALMFERKGLHTAEEVLDKVLAGEMSSKHLQDLNSRNDNGEASRKTRAHYLARVQFAGADGTEYGQLKRFRDGRTELKLTGLSEEQQEALGERLEAVVREFMAGSSDA